MKKFITMLALITALLAVSIIGVSAAAGYADDFTEPPVDGKLENYDNWNPYSASAKNGATWEDGMLRFERLESNGLIWDFKTGLSGTDGFTMMDVMLNEEASAYGVGGYYMCNGYRVGPSGFKYLEPNVWHKVLMLSQMGDDGKCYYSMFVKDEATDSWVKKAGPSEMEAKDVSAGMRINWSDSQNRDIGSVMYIDNIEAHEGLYWKSLTLTDDQGTEIVVGDAVYEAATALTVSGELYNAMTLSSDMAENPTDLASVPIIIVYDENGMMLDCDISEYGIKYFENTLEATVNLGDYDKSEIASVKFYLWDSMENMLNIMEPVELK